MNDEYPVNILKHMQISTDRLQEILTLGKEIVADSPELQEVLFLHLDHLRKNFAMLTGFMLPDLSSANFDRVWSFLETQLLMLEGGLKVILDSANGPLPPPPPGS